MTTRWKLFNVLAVIVLLGVGILNIRQRDRMLRSPASRPAATPASADGGTLVYRLSTDPGSLCDWLDTKGSFAERVVALSAEGLAERSYDDPDRWVHKLATSWDIDEANLTYTFHLREGVRFQDGSPFTSDDVVFAFETILNPKVEASTLRSSLADVDGPPEKLDALTVRFRWKKPYYRAFAAIATVPIYPAHKLRFAPGSETDFNNNPFHRLPKATGPYEVVEWKQGQRIVLKRNDDYWGPPGYLDEIRYVIVPSNDTAFEMLRRQEISVMPVTAQQWSDAAADPVLSQRDDRRANPRFAYYYLGWNNRRPPFDDRRVRQALSSLVPLPHFIDDILHGLGRPVSGPFFFDLPESERGAPPYPFNPDAGVKRLAEAGWADHDQDGVLDKDGRRFEFTLLLPSTALDWSKLAEMTKQELRRVGITMTINAIEAATLTKALQAREFDACMMGVGLAWDDDPFTMWHSSQAANGYNRIGYTSPQADRLIDEFRSALEVGRRNQLKRELHRLIAEDQPITFLYTPLEPMIWDKRFRLEFFNYNPPLDLRRVSLRRPPRD